MSPVVADNLFALGPQPFDDQLQQLLHFSRTVRREPAPQPSQQRHQEHRHKDLHGQLVRNRVRRRLRVNAEHFQQAHDRTRQQAVQQGRQPQLMFHGSSVAPKRAINLARDFRQDRRDNKE